jgi:hypothetical protein
LKRKVSAEGGARDALAHTGSRAAPLLLATSISSSIRA